MTVMQAACFFLTLAFCYFQTFRTSTQTIVCILMITFHMTFHIFTRLHFNFTHKQNMIKLIRFSRLTDFFDPSMSPMQFKTPS